VTSPTAPTGELQFVQLLDFELERGARDGPAVCVEVAMRHRNANGVVHGSVVHAMLDSIMGMQCFRAAGRVPVATAEISVRFLRPIIDGRLEARARVLHTGRRVLVVEGDVRRSGVVMAVGQATFVRVGGAQGRPAEPAGDD
jgi:uncharacterized protein (TIGR00369 family)